MVIYGKVKDASIIAQFVDNNNDLNIGKNEWSELNKKYPKEDIFESLILNALNGNIRIPTRTITYNEALEDFKSLCKMKPLEFEEGPTYTKCEYKLPTSNLFVGQSNIGNKASDYFQQYNRFCCDSTVAASPVRTWQSEQYLRSLFNALWTLKCQNVTMATLRTIIGLRKYIASQFKPSAAKAVYNAFNSKIILDFSSGWGDRLCGFFGTEQTEYYMGLDPNTVLHPEYQKQIEMYKTIKNNKEADMICTPAEDMDYPSNCFDTVFTSPPYFNREKYSTDENQSYKRYKKSDDWVDNFLCATIEKTWEALKTDGVLAVNISDIYSGTKRTLICDPMNDFISEKLHGEFIACLGMKMTKRVNCHSIKTMEGIFVEPIWVWRKK